MNTASGVASISRSMTKSVCVLGIGFIVIGQVGLFRLATQASIAPSALGSTL